MKPSSSATGLCMCLVVLCWNRASAYPRTLTLWRGLCSNFCLFRSKFHGIFLGVEMVETWWKAAHNWLLPWWKGGGPVFPCLPEVHPKPWIFSSYNFRICYCKSRDRSSVSLIASICFYLQALKNAGFVKVSAIHKNDAFKRILHKELATLEKSEKSFANEFSQYEYDQAVSNWRSKIRFCEDGDLEWGLFLAEKPNG